MNSCCILFGDNARWHFAALIHSADLFLDFVILSSRLFLGASSLSFTDVCQWTISFSDSLIHITRHF